MRLRMSLLALLLALGIVSAACSSDEGDPTTTTTADAETETGGDDAEEGDASTSDGTGGTDETSTGSADSTTTTVDLSAAIPEYSIVEREESGNDGEGDIVVIELDPESYDALTDIDLQNVIADVVDEFPPVYEAHVVDSPDAVTLVLTRPADLNANQQRVLDNHYLVRLEEGFRIVFTGPFSDSGQTILGS